MKSHEQRTPPSTASGRIDVNIETQREHLQNHGRVGRKPKRESRSAEFRLALIHWKETTKSSRPSLRALARELKTSHALLQHYLDGLEEWQYEERHRREEKQLKEIRARAKAENRPMTKRECVAAILTPALLDDIESIRQDAKRGPLKSHQIEKLKLFAKQFPEAQQVLANSRAMTKQEEREADASERAAALTSAALETVERIKPDVERGQVDWRDVERLKYFASKGYLGAKEILEKHPQMVRNAILQKTIAVSQLKIAAASRLLQQNSVDAS